MKRIERNELKKKNKAYKIKVFFRSILISTLLLLILYTGLTVVDKINRSILLLENTAFFRYNELEKDYYEITFCGERYLLNTTELNSFITNTKIETKNTLKHLNIAVQEGKKQIEDIISRVADINE